MANRTLRFAPVLALAFASQPAFAQDQLSAQRSSDMRERSHRVEVVLDRGHATLVVRRTVENGGQRHDEARYGLFVPPSAVATGLRTLGSAGGQPQWFNADLMEANAAAERYRELTGIGGAYPKDPALLSWSNSGGLILQVFPVEPHGLKTVEYTLQMPLDYVEGRDHLQLPRMGIEEQEADVVVRAADPGDRILHDGRPLPAGEHLKVDAEGIIDLELERHDATTLGGAFAVVPFAKDKTLVHTRLEAAARLSTIPKGASVVVVLDASRSIGPQSAEAEVAAARAYLSNFVDAHVEVLTFDRTVHARHGGLVPVFEALADLARSPLTLGNGSQVDDAIEQADKVLANAPGARRIVVLTDHRTRQSLSTERLKTLLTRSGAIVHIGDVGMGAPTLSRDDQDEWAPLVRATGGLVWHGRADPGPAANMRKTYEEWARPLRIDRLFVQIDGGELEGLAFPETLAEGEAFDDARIAPAQPTGLRLAGELWATPLRARIEPTAAQNRMWAAFTFGGDLRFGLSDKEMMVLALQGRAVSPVTSYLAVEPGVRPSTEGLDLSGFGEGGGGIGDGIGLGGLGLVGTAFEPFDFQGFLDREMARAWGRCGGGGRKIDLQIETTGPEVVDVPSSEVTGAGGSTAIERCMTEAAWRLELPASFERHATATWRVRI